MCFHHLTTLPSPFISEYRKWTNSNCLSVHFTLFSFTILLFSNFVLSLFPSPFWSTLQGQQVFSWLETSQNKILIANLVWILRSGCFIFLFYLKSDFPFLQKIPLLKAKNERAFQILSFFRQLETNFHDKFWFSFQWWILKDFLVFIHSLRVKN